MHDYLARTRILLDSKLNRKVTKVLYRGKKANKWWIFITRFKADVKTKTVRVEIEAIVVSTKKIIVKSKELKHIKHYQSVAMKILSSIGLKKD
jgi:hypothetical protein